MEHTADFLKNVYRDLLSIRLFEEKQVEVYALGKVPGHIHSGIGEEAVAAGVVATRKQGDYFKFTHRPVGASVALGIPLNTMFAELMGKVTGNALGLGGVLHMVSREYGMVGFSGTLGCDIAVSDGAALSIQSLSVFLQVRALLGRDISLLPLAAARPVHLALSLGALRLLLNLVPGAAAAAAAGDRLIVQSRTAPDAALVLFALCCAALYGLGFTSGSQKSIMNENHKRRRRRVS